MRRLEVLLCTTELGVSINSLIIFKIPFPFAQHLNMDRFTSTCCIVVTQHSSSFNHRLRNISYDYDSSDYNYF